MRFAVFTHYFNDFTEDPTNFIDGDLNCCVVEQPLRLLYNLWFHRLSRQRHLH